MAILVNARFLSQSLTGVQRHGLEVALQLRERFAGDTIRFFCPPGIRQTQAAEQLQAEVIGQRNGHLWEQLELPQAARRAAKGQPVPLLCTGNTGPLAYSPSVLTVHDTAFLNRQWVSWQFSLAYRQLIPLMAQRAQTLVTVSDFSRQELSRFLRVPAETIQVVYNGVSPTLAQLAEAAPQPLAALDSPYILAVSSLDPRKNFSRLVAAFQQLRPPGLQLCIVGDSNSIFRDEQLKQRIAADPSIRLLGRVNDAELAALYRHARLFAFPSLYEGFGLPPLEAMACGCPTVVSRVTSLPEVCGDAAHYIEEPTRVSDIAAALDAVLQDETLRQSLIQRGRQQSAQFTWERAGAAYARLLAPESQEAFSTQESTAHAAHYAAL